MSTQPKPGLYVKFEVKRIVGEDKPGQEYFVLSPSHDPIARFALACYAQKCREEELNELATDLLDGLARVRRGESFYGN